MFALIIVLVLGAAFVRLIFRACGQTITWRLVFLLVVVVAAGLIALCA